MKIRLTREQITMFKEFLGVQGTDDTKNIIEKGENYTNEDINKIYLKHNYTPPRGNDGYEWIDDCIYTFYSELSDILEYVCIVLGEIEVEEDIEEALNVYLTSLKMSLIKDIIYKNKDELGDLSEEVIWEICNILCEQIGRVEE